MNATMVAAAAALLALPAAAQDQTNISLKPTPPPISCLDFFKGVKQLTFTGLYMKMGEAEDSGLDEAPTAWGFQAEAAGGGADGLGAIANAMFLKINVPVNNEDNPGTMLGTNLYLVKDLVQGEKRDIAGEITEKKPTVALFGGAGLTITSFTMENVLQDLDFSMLNTEISLPVGLAAELPLNPFISLVPFGRFAWSHTSMSLVVPYFITVPTPPYVYYTTTSVDSGFSDTRFDYGADINLRPFRNAPEWKISVGTVLSQVEGMSKGNLLFIASIKREWGKYYSSTMFGPKLY
jgi:hypothetical protein